MFTETDRSKDEVPDQRMQESAFHKHDTSLETSSSHYTNQDSIFNFMNWWSIEIEMIEHRSLYIFYH